VGKGKFVVLEGIDGAGTTTQISRLQRFLEARGIKSVITREPSDGPVGTVIRNALRGRIRLPEAGGGGPLADETIALLFAADRVDHLASEIVPALERGVWVLSDRYVDSSVAYQGTLIDIDWVMKINRYAVRPDLTFFFDVDVDAALGRINASRVQKDIFEKRELLLRVAEGYRKLYEAPTPDVVRLDANLPADKVYEDLTRALATRLLGQ
jgi:dTMP kinase